MNSTEFKDTVCRICLDEGKLFDWKNTLKGHDELTYKDCYFKYTQIESIDTNLFSTKLCENCVKGLQNVHEFILKALDSYNFLLEVNGTNSEMENSIINDEMKNYNFDKFETVLVKNTDSKLEDKYECETIKREFEYSDEELFVTMDTVTVERKTDSNAEGIIFKSTNKWIITENEKDDTNVNQTLKADNANVNTSRRIITKNNIKYDINIVNQDDVNTGTGTEGEIELRKIQTEKSIDIKRTRKKYVKKKPKMDPQNTPCMCSICSRILNNKYALKRHEKTHIENRERKVPCPICGVKFFDRENVVNHMHIHDEKREKKHKCEFCGKAFYAKGILNVHRRVHLGQMVPCSLCEKQFYRQVDLDIHMNKHSAIAINGVAKKRSRYLVHCTYCDKQILSTNYKSHTATHLNKPLVKCLICEKEFFSRASCKEHLKLKHDKKTRDEWDPFILSYDNKRLSHLLLGQTTEIIPTHK